MVELNYLLVPIDFSPASRAAFDQAVQLASGENATVLLLHVLDSALADFAAAHELGAREEIFGVMRARAERELAGYRSLRAEVELQTMTCQGVPFLEIIRKADELRVDAIVMAKTGVRGSLEKLLFGTTAERVVRGSTRTVVVLPAEPTETPAV